MKNVLRSIFVATVAGLLMASASIAVRRRGGRSRHAPLTATWSVVIYTLYGDCDRGCAIPC